MLDWIIKLILLIGLVLLLLVWTVTNPTSVSLVQLKRPSSLLTSSLSMLAILQIFDFVQFNFSVGSFSFVIVLAGFFIFLFGIALSIWAKLVMKNNWGHPAQHDISRQQQLVTSGPFGISRNPIYVGLLATFVGFELALQSYLVLFALPLFWIIKKTIIKEEMLLTKFFGKPYVAYCKKVPRFLFF